MDSSIEVVNWGEMAWNTALESAVGDFVLLLNKQPLEHQVPLGPVTETLKAKRSNFSVALSLNVRRAVVVAC